MSLACVLVYTPGALGAGRVGRVFLCLLLFDCCFCHKRACRAFVRCTRHANDGGKVNFDGCDTPYFHGIPLPSHLTHAWTTRFDESICAMFCARKLFIGTAVRR